MAMTPQGMVDKIKAASPGISNDPEAYILAMCTGIIAEISSNAELVPLTTDQGTAGAGIITGKVI